MKYRLILFILILLSSCASFYKPSYIGRSYSPTSTVEFFFRETDISRDYEIMGKVTAAVSNRAYAPEAKRAQSAIEALAKEKGADAILFESNPSLVTKIENQDNNSKVITSTSNDSDNYITALLVKYKN